MGRTNLFRTLIVETSGKTTQISIIENRKKIFFLHNGGYFRHIETLLDIWKIISEKKGEFLSLIIISAGPGYFTSLRVGFAFVKALAFSKRIPVVPVNTLDAMAMDAFCNKGKKIFAFKSIKENKIFYGIYKKEGNSIKRKGEIKIGNFSDIPFNKEYTYIGDTEKNFSGFKEKFILRTTPTMKSLEALGIEIFKKTGPVDLKELEPFYFWMPEYKKHSKNI